MKVEQLLSDMIKDWSVLTRLAMECDEENFELYEYERMIMKTHDYEFFDWWVLMIEDHMKE